MTEEQIRRETCARHESFERDLRSDFREIKDATLRIHERIDNLVGQVHRYEVELAEVRLRTTHLEKWVYGAVAVASASFITAIAQMIYKAG